jgi:AraC-like DNA-binding protein
MSAAQLRAELSRRALCEGPNVGLWPGLTIYRFTRPTQPRWDEIESLSIGIIVGASEAFTAVMGSHRDFDCRILAATPHQPTLCFVLEIDPKLVRSVSGSMRGLGMAVGQSDDASALDDAVADTVLRFLGSLSTTGDRRVLAPLHVQELVYRVLQGEQRVRLMQLATYQANGNPVAAALDYISAHLAEPLTVDTLAAQVCLSPSAFSRVFRETTGRSPYQYVKATRLDRARQLLDDGRFGVADVSRSVGYTSASHFIKEFRSRFGATPGDYADRRRVPLAS